MNAQDFAIVIGINQYRSENLPELYGPHRDAEAFLGWLTDQAPGGGGLPPPNGANSNTVLILGTNQPHGPTAFDIHAAFKAMAARATPAQPKIGRRLYVFMAGHGAGSTDRVEDVGLLPATYDQNETYYVVGRKWVEVFQTKAAFDEILLFMDCCRDQIPFEVSEIPPGIASNPLPVAQPVKTLVGYAAQFNAKARERPIPPDPDVRGVFTCALLEALRTPHQLRTDDLKRLVEQRVRELRPPGTSQEASLVCPHDFVVFGGPVGRETTKAIVRLQAPAARIEIYSGADLAAPFIGCDVDPGIGEYTFELERGRIYLFQIPEPGFAPGTGRHAYLSLAGGEERDVRL